MFQWNETKVSGYDLYRDMTPAWDAEGYITDLYNDEARSSKKKYANVDTTENNILGRKNS